MLRIIVTGGAGFIGSALIHHLIDHTDHVVLNYDKLTYAGVLESLSTVSGSERYQFVQGDICDEARVQETLSAFQPDVIANLAAETHVDRSIDGPGEFMRSNVNGAFTLLQQALSYYRLRSPDQQARFRFHHISTDEVFGSLGETGLFSETSPYDPRSPYSASKAASDHLVRAWGHTYGLPILVTNCSNNYGPRQFPEKLIPLTIIRALAGKTLPVYGDGSNVRDWLFVDDHARALRTVFELGAPGQTYNIGGAAEMRNIDVVRTISAVLDELEPRPDGRSYSNQIVFVSDRPGHDQRYAIDSAKICRELGWAQQMSFQRGIATTVQWYLDNRAWWTGLLDQRYDAQRLGLEQQRVGT